jgi:hypothetical protein
MENSWLGAFSRNARPLEVEVSHLSLRWQCELLGLARPFGVCQPKFRRRWRSLRYNRIRWYNGHRER